MNNKYSRRSKENEKVDLFFASLIERFHQAMFGIDHDDPKTPQVDVFQIFNRAWVTFCDNWNKKAKKVGADKNAFYDYAINKDI